MGRRIITAIVICALALSGICVSADETRTDSDKKHMTARADLPEITLYCDKYDSSKVKKSDIDVQAFSGKTKLKDSLKDAYIFDESSQQEGITYFVLLDTSTSMNQYGGAEGFRKIKESILRFTENELDSKDKVFILPFSREIDADHERGMNPTTSDIKQALSSISATGTRTNIYSALGEISGIAEKIDDDESYPERKVVLLFTDAREFNNGGTEKRPKEVDLVSSGIGIYAFMSGSHKADKDSLRDFVIDQGGTVYDGELKADLKNMEIMLQKSLVIKARIKNVSDMINRYDVKVYQDTDLACEQTGIKVPNTEGVKDAASIMIQKTLIKFWWILLIIAVAVIAFIVLRTIKKNKGIVNVDGKVVYGGNIQKKYHIKGQQQKTTELVLRIESKSGEASVQNVEFESSLMVGRSSMCDVYFDDAKMSRQHFAVEDISGSLFVEDLESTGGTYLNGVRVFEKQKLSRGSIITAGATKIVIEDIKR